LPEDKTLLALRYLYQLDTLSDFRMILDALSLVPRSGAEEADSAATEAPEAVPEPSSPSAADNRLAELEARLRALEEQK
jgi:hypothetical protein